MPRPKFRVAVVGRPNVGKSTLFNRFAKRHKAIVSSIAGTTRDRKEGEVELAGMKLTLIDTGGLEDDADSSKHAPALSAYILQKAAEAARAADIVLFVVDGREVFECNEHFIEC
jgi:GTPase